MALDPAQPLKKNERQAYFLGEVGKGGRYVGLKILQP